MRQGEKSSNKIPRPFSFQVHSLLFPYSGYLMKHSSGRQGNQTAHFVLTLWVSLGNLQLRTLSLQPLQWALYMCTMQSKEWVVALKVEASLVWHQHTCSEDSCRTQICRMSKRDRSSYLQCSLGNSWMTHDRTARSISHSGRTEGRKGQRWHISGLLGATSTDVDHTYWSRVIWWAEKRSKYRIS